MSITDRYMIRGRAAAIFIEQYIGMYFKHGDRERKLSQIEFAIEELDQAIPRNQYSAIQSQCYFQKAGILCSLSRFDEAIMICEMMLTKAKAVKDYFFASTWCILLSNIYNGYRLPGSFWLQYKYYFLGLHYALKTDNSGHRKAYLFLSDENLIERLDYDYLATLKNKFAENLLLKFAVFMEAQNADVLFYSKSSEVEVSNLRHALNLRERNVKDRKLRYTNNSAKVVIDKAQIAFLTGQYGEAEVLLRSIINFYKEKRMSDTSITYTAHQILAHVATRKLPVDYAKAIAEFEACLVIAEQLQHNNTFAVRQELGYLYNQCGLLEQAEEINYYLWQETRSIAPEIRKTYYADALRNVGYLYYLQGKDFVARNMLRRALKEYANANAPIEMIQYGQARTYQLLAEWYCSNSLDPSEVSVETAIDLLETALKYYKSSVGLEHPEAKASAKRLVKIKTKQ